MDVSDQNPAIRIANWPVYGVYMPDAIASYDFRGRAYIITANEGDAREYAGYADVRRFRALSGDIPICADSSRFNDFFADNTFKTRSDDKGPEPEGVTVAKLFGTTYAFIGLERVGGVMVSDVSNPYAPSFVQYFNNRDFSVAPGTPGSGDQGAEGLIVIDAAHSPIRGVPLLVVANEVSAHRPRAPRRQSLSASFLGTLGRFGAPFHCKQR